MTDFGTVVSLKLWDMDMNEAHLNKMSLMLGEV